TNLVTSTVTVAAATLQQARVFQPARLFGVTTLDVVRAFVFTGQALSTDPTRLRVPVIGGHSGATIVPLYSQAQPPIHAEEATLAGLVHRVQFGGDETVTSKQGAGSATTCMAYAGLRFVKAVLAGSRGEDVTEEAFVYVPGSEGGREMAEELGVEYFAVRTVLGPESPFGDVDGKEREMVEVAVRELRTNVAIGLGYMR
ncbi:LDH C-terminal domain-like protein, partial [Aspergillus aculeatinus CBS 121060]